jgi:glucokinase
MGFTHMIGAVDIGGTKIAVGMIDESGRVLAQVQCPTDPERGPQDALARITAMLRETASQADQPFTGIGIGSTGPVDALTGTIGDVPFLPGWDGFELVRELSKTFDASVAMENDADAAALGEVTWGAGQGARNFIYVTVSTGIGVGLILDGRLYHGAGGWHPEIGHHIIDPSGPACECGAHGCWESLASGTSLAAWYNAQHHTNLNARALCELAEQGDVQALEAMTREGRYLGLGLANLVTMFVPDIIALGGGLMQSRHLFLDTALEVVRTHCGLVPFEQVRILPAGLGSQAGLIGAACVWLHRFKTDKNFKTEL